MTLEREGELRPTQLEIYEERKYVMVTEGTRNDTSEAEWSKQSESGIRTVCVVIRVSGTTLLCYSTPANEMHIYTERAKRTLYSSAEC